MPIRNPFARRPEAPVNNENLRPDSSNGASAPTSPGTLSPPAFERMDSKASSAVSIASAKSQDTGEYKMSVVNDSGVYLPPSPTHEKEAAWPTRYLSSRKSTDTRSSIGDIEHFSISRESFDSYRRSFDVSARSPIINHEPATRQSLDSGRFARLPRTSLHERRLNSQPLTEEERFEDVGLNDEQKTQPKKKGFFSKFERSEHQDATPASPSQPGSVSRFLMPGRKRAQSGQGAELGPMDRPRTTTPAPQEVST